MTARLLVTGASGYLGSELLRRAREGRADVVGTAFTRATRGLQPLDVRDRTAVDRLVAELQPDAVVHTAFVQSGPEAWRTTVDGSRHVAEAAAAVGARLVHVSTDVVFDGEREGRYTERDEPRPVSAYGRAKAAAESAVVEAHPRALVVRTGLIYGGEEPGQHERLALAAADGEADVTFFIDEVRCPVVVSELASALLELTAGDLAGPLHLSGPDAASRSDFARLIVRAHGGDPAALRSGPSSSSPEPRPRNCALDSSRAYGLLQTRMRGVLEVLA